MAHGFRLVLMWLMTLAVSVQGVVAYAMPLCPPSHQMAAQSQHLGTALAAGHHGHGMAGLERLQMQAGESHHGMAAGHVHSQDMETPHAPDGADAPVSGHDMLSCCSANCSMVGLTVVLPRQPSQAASPRPVHPMASLYSGVALAGLDRPPKPLFV
jgi:hypothetical protein